MAELEAVAEVAEAVGEEAFEVAEAARNVDPKWLMIGLGIGLVSGGVLGYGIANKRLRVKYEQIAEEEIDEMREHFRRRLIAKEEKPDLSTEASKIVEREGYDGPATPVVEEEEDGTVPPEEEEVYEDPVLAEETVEEVETTQVENVFDKDEPQDGGWDYEAEIARRRPEFPYIIHGAGSTLGPAC